MPVATNRHNAGVFLIDGKPYFLARDDKNIPQVQERQLPTQPGDPESPQTASFDDWSRGMLDSQGRLRGTVEYGLAYLGQRGRILPPPKLYTITTSAGADLLTMVEVTAPAARVLVMGGTKSVEINSSHAVAATQTFGAGAISGRAILFNDIVAIPMGDSTDFQYRNASGTYAANSISKKARCFGRSGADLVKGKGATWAKCSAADFYSVDNWGTEYNIGRRDQNVTEVFGANRFDYVMKADGLFTFDSDTSDEVPYLRDLDSFPSTENRFWFPWQNEIMVCTRMGLWRVLQGAARTVGVEEAPYNESEVSQVYPTAGASFGRWAYIAWYRPSTGYTYITLCRRAEGDGESGGSSPFTVVSVFDKFSGYCRTMLPTAISGSNELWYAAGANVKYFLVNPDGLPAEFLDSGSFTVVLPNYDFGSPFTVKTLRSVQVKGSNFSAARNVQWAAVFDGGSSNNVGSALTSLASEFAEAFWTAGSNDYGRRLQLTATIGVNSTTTAPEINNILVNYEERPSLVPGWRAHFRFRDFQSYGDFIDRRSAKDARAALIALVGAGAITITDCYGDSYSARLTRAEGGVTGLYRGEMPQDDEVIDIRKLAYS